LQESARAVIINTFGWLEHPFEAIHRVRDIEKAFYWVLQATTEWIGDRPFKAPLMKRCLDQVLGLGRFPRGKDTTAHIAIGTPLDFDSRDPAYMTRPPTRHFASLRELLAAWNGFVLSSTAVSGVRFVFWLSLSELLAP